MTHPIFKLSEEYVYDYCKIRPITGTFWGITKYDEFWGDLSVDSYAEELLLLTSYQTKLQDLLASNKPTNKWEDIAFDTLANDIKINMEYITSEEYYYDLNSTASGFQNFVYVFDTMQKDTKEDWEKIRKRLLTFDTAMDQYINKLRQGLAKNKIVAKRQVLAVIKQSQNLLTNFGAALLTANKSTNLVDQTELTKLCDKSSAYNKLINFLTDEYLPKAHTNDDVGLIRYSYNSMKYIGNKIDIMDAYHWGFREVNKLLAEINALCKDFCKTPNKNYLSVIKDARQDKYFLIDDHDEAIKHFQNIQTNAVQKLSGKYFDIPDIVKDVNVTKMSIGDVVIAQYFPPSPDFSRKGTIYYGFEKDKPVALYDQLSTAYHEGFPGHHLQLGLQVFYKDKLSLLSRVTGYSGYAEGWALYMERFMHEINMYPHPYYVLGMLTNSLYRACRVIIDIGIHLQLKIPDDFFYCPGKVWTYEIARDLLVNVAGLTEVYATDEVNRYCGWPGQAICYKLGERAIMDLRDKFIKLCYDNNCLFDYKEFHNLILGFGGVSLEYLTNKVNEYLKEKFAKIEN